MTGKGPLARVDEKTDGSIPLILPVEGAGSLAPRAKVRGTLSLFRPGLLGERTTPRQPVKDPRDSTQAPDPRIERSTLGDATRRSSKAQLARRRNGRFHGSNAALPPRRDRIEAR